MRVIMVLNMFKVNTFTFIDSDDFLDPGLYKEVLRLHRQNPSDVYVFGYKDYPIDGSGGHVLKQCRCDNAESLAQLYLDMKRNYLMFPVVNKSPLFLRIASLLLIVWAEQNL